VGILKDGEKEIERKERKLKVSCGNISKRELGRAKGSVWVKFCLPLKIYNV
jgi:hypothetical protein